VSSEITAAPRARLKLPPLVVVTALGFAIPYLGAFLAAFCSRLFHSPSPHGATLPWLYAQHAGQCLVALLVIALLRRWVPADYGLHWPGQKTYFLPAALWGALFGLIMTVVDYAPQLLSHSKPDLGYPLTAGNVAGWLFFEGVYVGPTEEIPFRALLVTYLAATMPGKLRLGPLRDELGRRARRTHLRAPARDQLQPAQLAPGPRPAGLRLPARRALRVLAREVPQHHRAHHRSQRE
jgi:hypothetical protein